MKDKQLVTDNKILEQIIIRFFAFIIAFNVLYNTMYYFIDKFIENDVAKTITCFGIQFIMIYILTNLSILTPFNQYTMDLSQFGSLKRKVAAFIIIFTIFNFGYAIYSVEEKVQEALESNYTYKYVDTYMREKLDEEELKLYESMVNEKIDEVRSVFYKYTMIGEGIKIIMLILMIPVSKWLLNKQYKKLNNDAIIY